MSTVPATRPYAIQRSNACACGALLRLVSPEIVVIELSDTGNRAWRAELWTCPDCGHQVLQNFADRPLYVFKRLSSDPAWIRLRNLYIEDVNLFYVGRRKPTHG